MLLALQVLHQAVQAPRAPPRDARWAAHAACAKRWPSRDAKLRSLGEGQSTKGVPHCSGKGNCSPPTGTASLRCLAVAPSSAEDDIPSRIPILLMFQVTSHKVYRHFRTPGALPGGISQ